MNKSKTKCLVTGGAGFIGAALVKKLVNFGYEVTVIDNLITGKLNNLNGYLKKIRFLRSSIKNQKEIKKIINNVDYIFHLAALTNVRESFIQPKKYFSNNVESTLCLMELINSRRLKKIIYTASSSCYGDYNGNANEKTNINLLSPYAETKWISEQIISYFSKIKKFNFISLRLFNVYGPKSSSSSSYSGVITKFINLKKKNLPLTIFGDGQQTRSFIHVHDVVDVMIKVIKSKIKKDIFNVGSSKSISINKLAKIFKSKHKFLKEIPGEIKYSSADIRKIKKILKIKPKIDLQEGINNIK